MWIIQEPKKVALWNKRHFEKEKRTVCSMFKIFSTYICWINKKMQHLWVRGAVRPLKWPLGVKWLSRCLLYIEYLDCLTCNLSNVTDCLPCREAFLKFLPLIIDHVDGRIVLVLPYIFFIYFFYIYLPECCNLYGDIQQQRCWGMVATCRGYTQWCTTYENTVWVTGCDHWYCYWALAKI
jgi:hypothetical protein